MVGASSLSTLKKDKIDDSEKSERPLRLEGVIVDEGSTEAPPSTTLDSTTQTGVVREPGSSTTWEILKSIVYGGLIESIASLGIVTSSASSDATTLNILVLSLANLMGGLFILVHHIWDLKSEQPRTNNQTNASVDRYYEVLGKRENFYLHLCIAILSFIIFGLVPPLVYAFTFSESSNKDLKLAAVAGASAICIALLSITKAYVQRPNTYLIYLKTVLYYLSTGAMTSVVSYLAGELVKELIEKLGWFNTQNSNLTLLLPEMSVDKPRFGSY
ncbi:membrane protein of ER body-like protein isoform X4 [Prosopis cineraria]|uniref:membrane protein of ER body-like protein isoform X4 n=1 Tax=Prosopis cineraria TaxID=364024 RepID=UPI0024101810|nr:membrane protein of ER body-like protein isoform X4 [Prosopis cineraria]